MRQARPIGRRRRRGSKIRHPLRPLPCARFDRTPVARQNGRVRRLILLAIGLSALLWTATAHTGSVPADDIITMSDAASCLLLTSGSHEPGDSNKQWRAPLYPIAAATESILKSALVHAELASAPSPRAFDPARAASSPDPPVRPASPYLLHTPLLI